MNAQPVFVIHSKLIGIAEARAMFPLPAPESPYLDHDLIAALPTGAPY